MIRDAVRIGPRRWKRINRRSIGARMAHDQPMTHSPRRRRHCVAVAPCSGLRRRLARRLATRAPRRIRDAVRVGSTMGKERPPVRCPQSWHGERTDDASTKNEEPRTKNFPTPDAATASPWLLVAAYGDGPLVGSRQGHRGVIRDAVRIGSRRWERINRRSIGARSRGTGNDHPMTHQRTTKNHERRTSPRGRRHCVAVAPCSGLRRRPTRRLATRAPRRDSGCGSYRFETMGKDQPPFHRCPQSWHGERPPDDASTDNEEPRTKNFPTRTPPLRRRGSL